MIGKIAPGSSVELLQFALFMHVPVLVFAPFLGDVIDRSNKVLVLILVDILRGAAVLVIPAMFYWMGNLYAFYIPAFFLAVANMLFSPAKSAAIPELFGALRLLRINAVLWGLGIVATMGGFVLGGWFFDFRTWELSFYSDGASYLISVLFLAPLFFLPRPGGTVATPRAVEPHREARWYSGVVNVSRSFHDALRLIRENRLIAFCLVGQTSLMGMVGILYVVGIAHIQSVFPPDKTIYLSAVGIAGTIGLLCGSGIAMLERKRLPANRVIAYSTLLLAAALIGLAGSETLVPIMIWTFVLGVASSPIFVICETLLQVHTPAGFRGRVFSAREVTTRSAYLLTSLLATIVTIVVTQAMIIFSIGVLLAGLGLVLLRKNYLKV